MRRFVFLAVLFAIACAGSGTRPKTIIQPGIHVHLMQEPFFGSRAEAPASIEIVVHNRATVPITLRRVELSSPGMAEWEIVRAIRELMEPIPAGQTKSRVVTVTAITTDLRPVEPLSLRAVLHFESEGKHWREVFFSR